MLADQLLSLSVGFRGLDVAITFKNYCPLKSQTEISHNSKMDVWGVLCGCARAKETLLNIAVRRSLSLFSANQQLTFSIRHSPDVLTGSGCRWVDPVIYRMSQNRCTVNLVRESLWPNWNNNNFLIKYYRKKLKKISKK